jgi:lipoate-protein ligase A
MIVPPRPGAENMARDAGLMDRARETGEAVFSVYSWERPTLSLGRNQTASGRYDLEQIRERSIDVVRRPTGGRALLHWHEVTYSVTAPIADADSLRNSYERINRILLDGLSRLGVGVSESRGGAPTPSPGELPCFSAPAEGELMVNGAKLVGSAQYREAGALLQHGSILIEDDQPMIASVLKRKSSELNPPRAATLIDALGRAPTIDEVAAALFDSVRSLEDANATLLDDEETKQNTARHTTKYQNELWTWRR